jgi:uncharacterized membrane protein YjgN (DUF898 family)
LWLVALLPVIVGLAAVVVKAVSRMPPGGGAILGLLLVVWVLALPFIYGAFKAVEWRWWVSGIRFGEVSFNSDLSTRALYGLYWKVIGWFVLIDVLFSAYLFACVGLIAGFRDLPHLALKLQGNLAVTAATIVGYLGIIVAVNVVLRVYLLRDIWARVAASATAFDLDAAANVAAKGELADALGEGLAGGLDVVGF